MMKKRKLFTAPPLAIERMRDSQFDLGVRLAFMIGVAALAVIGLCTLIF